MSKKYIRINTVKDIDLSKVNLGNINDRYIDEAGNRFATRFNLRTRKIQIVRIALGEDEAINSRGKVVRELIRKRSEPMEEPISMSEPTINEMEEDLLPAAEETADAGAENIFVKHPHIPDWIKNEKIIINPNVNGDSFSKKLGESLTTESERLFGILGNMKNAGLLDKKGSGADPLLELTNIYDHEIEPSFKEAQSKLEEITKYPKELHDYHTVIEHKYLRKLDNMDTHGQWGFIKAYIIGSRFLNGLEATLKFLTMCRKKLEGVDEDALDSRQKQSYEDAHVSIDFVRDTTEQTIGDVIGWMIQCEVY